MFKFQINLKWGKLQTLAPKQIQIGSTLKWIFNEPKMLIKMFMLFGKCWEQQPEVMHIFATDFGFLNQCINI